MNNSKYYFCYSRKQNEFLKEKGFRFITGAKHITTNNIFWLYEGTDELNEALGEYRKLGN